MPLIRLTVFVAILLLAAGCSTARLPAITDLPTNTLLEGKVVWHDLITDTPEASKRFYQELFGWQFEEVGFDLGSLQSVNYTLIRHNGRLIGGMVDQTRLQTRVDISQWVSLISVRDADAATATLQAAGGVVFSSPVDLAERGRLAVVADPQGALFALLQTNLRDPLDQDEADVGGFLWDELWTGDVDAAAAFYRKLAHYDADGEALLPKGIAVNSSYRLLGSHGKPRVGIMQNPVDGLQPIWVNYLRISDAAALDAVVARVEELGGQVLLEPQDRDIGGRVALIAGPSGAGIALQTWPFTAKQ
jgi:predicted enzyme related to lactoylglutathione lyase